MMHADRIPSTLGLIVSSAFTGQAAIGGFLGVGVRKAVRYGIARGLLQPRRDLRRVSLAPYAATWLATNYGLPWVGYYLSASTVLSLIGLYIAPETRDSSLS
jgi:Sodium:alanine symporter family